MGIIAALIISSLVAAAASAGVGIANTVSQQKTNQRNIDMQNAANQQNQYNIEHAHQIEMNDLKEAGLNPVLTATGGNGAPITSIQAAKAQAPQFDGSGISSAINGMQHALTMSMMMQMRQDISAERNATLASIAKGHDAQSAANAALRASRSVHAGQSLPNSAKALQRGRERIPQYIIDIVKNNNLWE